MHPANPRAVIEISRVDKIDGEIKARYDSWEQTQLIKSVSVDLTVDESSQAKWTLFDEHYRLIDAFSGYTEKAVVRVYLGYGQDLGEPVFKGLLSDIERRRGETIFTAFDMGYVMKLEKKAGYKNKKDDLAIIRELVTRNPLVGASVPPKKPGDDKLKFNPPPKVPDWAKKAEPHRSMIQDEQTDWEHVMERAKAAGLHIFVRHDTVFARYPSDYSVPVLSIDAAKEPTLLTDWEFRYHTLLNRDAKPKEVTHRRRGQAGKRVEGKSGISMKAEVSHLNFKQDTPNPSKSKLSARAQAQKELEREHAFEARITTLFPKSGHRPDVLDTVSVTNVGKLLSGDYIVDSAKYDFAPGQLDMALDLYRDIKTA